MATELIERQLTPIEIKQRQVDHLRLLTEIDNFQSEIDEHRRCAKDAANEVARIQSRERELRRELRSGTCWEAVHVEPRQKSLEFADTLVERPTDPGIDGIDGMSDSPDPETDPPGPMARHGEGPLLDAVELRHLITCVRPKEFWPSLKEVATWHTDVMADVQRWCRIEHTRAHPIAGQPMPLNFDMPNVLQNVEFAKPKRGARPFSQPKKRRSGSTANTP